MYSITQYKPANLVGNETSEPCISRLVKGHLQVHQGPVHRPLGDVSFQNVTQYER